MFDHCIKFGNSVSRYTLWWYLIINQFICSISKETMFCVFGINLSNLVIKFHELWFKIYVIAQHILLDGSAWTFTCNGSVQFSHIEYSAAIAATPILAPSGALDIHNALNLVLIPGAMVEFHHRGELASCWLHVIVAQRNKSVTYSCKLHQTHFSLQQPTD